jgi:hypothetical protein
VSDDQYIWRNVPSYEKSRRKSVVKMPKGHIRDSGLTHFIRGITSRKQLLNYPNAGASFKSFVCEALLKGRVPPLFPAGITTITVPEMVLRSI